MRTIYRWLAAALCLAFLLAGCAREEAGAPELLEPVGVDLDFAPVVRMPLGTVRQFAFSVVPYTEDLSFPLDGAIESVRTWLGADVRAGDILLTLDESALLEEEERLSGELLYLQQANSLEDRIARIDIDLARLELERLRSSGADAASVVRAQNALEMQELLLCQARETRAAAETALAADLGAVRARLGQNELTAPFDGTIVSIDLLHEGDSVQAYEALITIADDSRPLLLGEFITEGLVSHAREVWARIGSEDYAIEYVPLDMDEYLSVIFAGGTPRTRFRFAEPPEGVSCGDYAAVCLLSGQEEEVLVIPLNALYVDGAGRYVYRLEEDGSRARVPVRTGLTNGIVIQITEGLEEGDCVYVKE